MSKFMEQLHNINKIAGHKWQQKSINECQRWYNLQSNVHKKESACDANPFLENEIMLSRDSRQLNLETISEHRCSQASLYCYINQK